MNVTRSVSVLALLMVSATVSAADYVSMSGKDLYLRFCAACHGGEARGDGPVASAFKVEMPDLTLIARRHDGKFPYEQIEKIIDGRHVIAAHGSRAMPVWGEEFAREEIGNPEAEQATRIVIGRIADHLWSIQQGDNLLDRPRSKQESTTRNPQDTP